MANPERMVTVNLKHSVGLRGGRLYGPGRGIQVPESLARALGVRELVAPVAETPAVEASVIGSGLGGLAANDVVFTPAAPKPKPRKPAAPKAKTSTTRAKKGKK